MIWKFLRLLYHLSLRDRLDLTPRMFADEYRRDEITSEVGHVFSGSHARSPRTVDLLKHRYRVATGDELLERLPERKRRRRPKLRLFLWIMRLQGLLPYEPNVQPSLRRAAREGRLSSRTTLVRRTRADELESFD